MCWSETASLAMTGLGIAAAGVTAWRGMPAAVPATLGYFAAMEALQAAGYGVIDQCGTPANEAITYLSVLHIVFQPFLINLFAMALVVGGVSPRMRAFALSACALSAAIMLVQLYPFGWAGPCRLGDTLCGPELCTRSGTWHLAWDVPYNGLLVPVDAALGTRWAFPTYTLTVFLVPLLYGAWRFVIFHALAGPILATQLTDQPTEYPAVWCLFSVGLVLIALSPWLWRRFEARPATAA